jgi:hypothetical protein
LDVAQRDTGIQGGDDERVPKRGRHGLDDPGAAGCLADDSPAPCRSSRKIMPQYRVVGLLR